MDSSLDGAAGRPRRRPFAIPTLVAVLVVLVVLGAGAFAARYYRAGLEACHPYRTHVTEADRARARASLPTLEDAEFRTDDGLTIRGFYLPSKNGVVVVMGHGLTETRMRFLPDAEMLARHGYGALFFDWRAHGESDGDTSTFGDREQRDFHAALDFAAKRAPAGKLASLGFSIGSSAVAEESARNPLVRAVILEAIWPSLDEEIHGKLPGHLRAWLMLEAMQRSGVVLADIRPIDSIATIAPRPLFIMGGSIEGDTPPPINRRVFEAAGDPKELWIVDGADHGTYLATQPEAYERRVIGFLDRAFGFGREGDR